MTVARLALSYIFLMPSAMPNTALSTGVRVGGKTGWEGQPIVLSVWGEVGGAC